MEVTRRYDTQVSQVTNVVVVTQRRNARVGQSEWRMATTTPTRFYSAYSGTVYAVIPFSVLVRTITVLNLL